MVKRRKGKYTPQPSEPLLTTNEAKKCVGYAHHFATEPVGMRWYICQCSVFQAKLNMDGQPLQIEPVPDLNPDNKLAERVRNEPGR